MLQGEETGRSLPIEYTWTPEARRATSDFLFESFPELMALFVWTYMKEERIPMIAIITRSSTRVKAFCFIYGYISTSYQKTLKTGSVDQTPEN